MPITSIDCGLPIGLEAPRIPFSTQCLLQWGLSKPLMEKWELMLRDGTARLENERAATAAAGVLHSRWVQREYLG